jgi:tripartite-type tricarboxylate transporter receptor subunit TctC
MKDLIRAAFAAFAALLAIAGQADAAPLQFPERPVKIVVPFPAGGTTDILARQVAAALQQRWHQAIIVDNRPGASGTIASDQLARTAPDGYTLMITATHHVINPGLYKSLKYDTRTAFTPLAEIASVPNVLVANPSFPAKNFQEFLTYVKAHPGTVNFGSSGTGGANHLSGELLKSMAHIDIVHIPYKGAAPALNDLLGGTISIMFDSVPGVLPNIKAGKLRPLAVTSLKRSSALPDVPTIDESGVKGFEATAWFGLYGPGHMAPELQQAISSAVLEVLRSQAIRDQFAQQGVEPGAMSQPQFASFVDAEITKWSKVTAAAKVTIDN